jgi:hypothetical protein
MLRWEFFAFPSWMNATPPLPCIKQFNDLYGQPMPFRIGGTTQDRATYDPAFDGYVSYHVDNTLDAPMALTFGPKYFDLIGQYSIGGRFIARATSPMPL